MMWKMWEFYIHDSLQCDIEQVRLILIVDFCINVNIPIKNILLGSRAQLDSADSYDIFFFLSSNS